MSGRVHILTDNTAQFSPINFPGKELVTVLPASNINSHTGQGAMRPGRASPPSHLPSAVDFQNNFTMLRQKTHDILVLSMSRSLGTNFLLANQAAAHMNGSLDIQVLDSHTTGPGLGLLVQMAARLASEGMQLGELQRIMRKAVAHVYSLICIPEFEYLARAGYLTNEQAQAGHMLGFLPLFTLEDERLNLMDKVRSPRRLLEAFQEFISEFETPHSVAFLKTASGKHFHDSALREFVTESFPGTHFLETSLKEPLISLIGPQSTGVIVIEKLEI